MTGLSRLGVSSLISYFIAVLLPAFDALIPLLPSETAVIALGVATAGSVDPRAAVLVALAALGAFLGDNAAYLLGRRFGPAAARRVFAGERGTRRRAWAEHSLDRFGARMIIGCRFIPAGRTATTLTCGLVGYPRRRFIVATAFAAVIWASYAFFIGRLGGRAFEDRPWAGLLLALGLTVVVSVLIEAARRTWAWRRSRHERARDRAAGPTALRRTGQGDGGRAARPHDLHTGCAGPAPRRDVLKPSIPWADRPGPATRASGGRAGGFSLLGVNLLRPGIVRQVADYPGVAVISMGKAAEADAAYIDAGETLREAGHLMRELGVNALKVRGENGDLQGTISSDMVVRRIAAGGDPRMVTVGEVASAAPTRRRAITARTLATIG